MLILLCIYMSIYYIYYFHYELPNGDTILFEKVENCVDGQLDLKYGSTADNLFLSLGFLICPKPQTPFFTANYLPICFELLMRTKAVSSSSIRVLICTKPLLDW